MVYLLTQLLVSHNNQTDGWSIFPLYSLKYTGRNDGPYLYNVFYGKDSELSIINSEILMKLDEKIDVTDNLNALQISCKKGNVFSCLSLARIYEYGSYGVKQNLTIAYEYYRKLKDSELSEYFHGYNSIYYRRNNDTLRSVIFGDLSLTSTESAIRASYEYFYGKNRPKSCYRAVAIIESLAVAIISSRAYPIYSPDYDNLTYEESFASDGEKLFQLGVKYASLPYVTGKDLDLAFEYFMKSYELGYKKGLLYYLILYFLKRPVSIDKQTINFLVSRIDSSYLDEAEIGYLNYLLNTNNIKLDSRVDADIPHSYKSSYSPNSFLFGTFHFYGIFKRLRSSRLAFDEYEKSVNMGYLPSYVELASQLITGEGVEPDCERAFHLLFSVVETGPWLKPLESLYKNKNSTYAKERAIDMGFPFLNEGSTSERTIEILKKKMMEGDVRALIYATANSSFAFTLRSIQTLYHFSFYVSAIILMINLILREFSAWIFGEESIEDLVPLRDIVVSVSTFFKFAIVMAFIISLVYLRIHLIENRQI